MNQNTRTGGPINESGKLKFEAKDFETDRSFPSTMQATTALMAKLAQAKFDEWYHKEYRKHWINIARAVAAQTYDDTLWATNIPGQEFKIGVGEAYIQQSLRWLHRVIERNDLEALKAIIEQRDGNEPVEVPSSVGDKPESP
jgi:hypothetical protein